MFLRDEMAVIDTINCLKPYVELIDILVELKEEGRGREGVKRLNLR
jgi:hypothetical protein